MRNTQTNTLLTREDIQSILCGKLQSISVPFQLQTNEKAYYSFQTIRMADRVNAVSYTVGRTKQKDVIKRTMIGNLLFGRAGAIIGGLSGESETKSMTKNVDKNEAVDEGTMILTNQRFLFVGKQVVSINYEDLLSIRFPHFVRLEIHYPSMTKGEGYTSENKEPALYFKGIMRLLGKDKSKVKENDIEQFLATDRILTPYNEDGSITCPSCDTMIKEYKESRIFFSTTKTYTCPTCGMIILK